MRGMKEGRSLGSMENVGFGTSVSFDIDEIPTPKRRRGSKKEDKEGLEDSEVTACPGCGHGIDEGEWLDALVGFTSGARDFMIGNPVRARIVQTLRNEVSRMKTPNPTEDWEMEIVSRLMNEIERIVSAEIRRTNMDGDNSVSAQRELIITEYERSILPSLESEIRQQVEKELWGQFEQAWRERSRE